MKTISRLQHHFADPPISYSPIPFWFLNGDLQRTELDRQLRLMRDAGIGTVVLHARYGHTMPYLSEEWFAAIHHCVCTCADLDMKAWIYDEDNWPSGYAGGQTIERYPEGQGKHLAMVSEPAGDDEVVAEMDGQSFVRRVTPWHPAYSDGYYIDLLDRKATDAFIETTYDRYAQDLGDMFGTVVVAMFNDEPGFYNHFHNCAPGTIVWTDDLPEQFQDRLGYDLTAHLPDLFEQTEGGAEVRRDFYRVVSDLALERYYLPLKQWCEDHGVALVGHINNEEYLVDHVRYNADYFTAMDGYHVPGIDIIGGEGDWHRAADSPAPKLASSAAHTRGIARCYCETYGASGWELSPAQMRRIGDWLSVRGVTRLVPHAFYYSIEGDRYNECPPSLFFRSPHWPYIPALLRYLRQWSWLLENTEPEVSVGVYYPIDAARGATTPEVPPSVGDGLDEANAGKAGKLGAAFRKLMDGLFRSQIEFDVLDDTALAEAETIPAEGAVRIGKMCYSCVIVPPGGPSEEAEQILNAAEEAGVRILRGDFGAVADDVGAWKVAELEPASEEITIARRRAADGSVFFIVNEGADRYEGTIALPLHGKVMQWDWATGRQHTHDAESTESGVALQVQLLGGSAACFSVEH